MINLRGALLVFLIVLLVITSLGVQIPLVKADAEADFETLFFGNAWFIGLLLFMILSVALIAISKYCVVFVIIITILFEVEYYTRLDEYGNHVWKMIILLFFALFVCIISLVDKRR